jgi:predicted MFS family arabinose efflux permease
MLSAATSLYKNAFTGLTKNTWLLSIVMLVNRSGTMVIPFMTIYCTQQLHFTLPQAGIVMALFGAGAIVGAYIGGNSTDKFGFYTQQLASLLLGGVMFIVVGFLRTYESLCIGTFILSVCNESFRPANAAAVAFYSKAHNTTRSISLNRLAINLGWAVGGTLGGILASINYHSLFWVDGATNIVAALLLLKLLPYGKNKPEHHSKVVKKKAYKDKYYVIFIIITFFFASCFFLLFTIQPVFFKTEWKFNEAFIGVLMALNGIIIVFAEMILVYKLERKRMNTFFIRIGFAVAALSFVCLNIFPPSHIAAIFCIALITIGEMLSMPFMNAFWIERSSVYNRGQYAALYAIAWSIAQIMAPLYGSYVADKAGFDILWWIVACVCVVAAFCILLLEQRINLSKQTTVISSA